MVRLSTDSSLEVASVCVDYLSERSLRDRGLFKSQPSLVDVRKLQSRIIESKIMVNNSIYLPDHNS